MSEETYADDASEVEPIAHYEETDDGLDAFRDDLWEHMEKPKTLPDDFDFDSDDHEDFEKVVDDERAARKSESLFNFAYGYANYGNSSARASAVGPDADLSNQKIVFKIPGWFASDELGQWEEWWFGSFEVAKQDGDEWTAMCVGGLEPLGDRNEDSYFRNPIDEEWIPLSLMEFGFVVEREAKTDHLIFERGLNSDSLNAERGKKKDADIVFKYIDHGHRYGHKIVIDSPFEAKDDIKDLTWEQFHPDWNGDNWTIDAEALWPAVEKLTMQGWSVCVAQYVENETTTDTISNAPHIPSEYKQEDA